MRTASTLQQPTATRGSRTPPDTRRRYRHRQGIAAPPAGRSRGEKKGQRRTKRRANRSRASRGLPANTRRLNERRAKTCRERRRRVRMFRETREKFRRADENKKPYSFNTSVYASMNRSEDRTTLATAGWSTSLARRGVVKQKQEECNGAPSQKRSSERDCNTDQTQRRGRLERSPRWKATKHASIAIRVMHRHLSQPFSRGRSKAAELALLPRRSFRLVLRRRVLAQPPRTHSKLVVQMPRRGARSDADERAGVHIARCKDGREPG